MILIVHKHQHSLAVVSIVLDAVLQASGFRRIEDRDGSKTEWQSSDQVFRIGLGKLRD